MKVETYRCDVCGKQKGDVNHWWVMQDFGGRNDDGHQLMQVESWSDTAAETEGTTHLCGAECVIKKVNEFLGSKA